MSEPHLYLRTSMANSKTFATSKSPSIQARFLKVSYYKAILSSWYFVNVDLYQELKQCTLDILIQKKSLDPIGLDGQGIIANYIPKFKVATMSLEVA